MEGVAEGESGGVGAVSIAQDGADAMLGGRGTRVNLSGRRPNARMLRAAGCVWCVRLECHLSATYRVPSSALHHPSDRPPACMLACHRVAGSPMSSGATARSPPSTSPPTTCARAARARSPTRSRSTRRYEASTSRPMRSSAAWRRSRARSRSTRHSRASGEDSAL